jgi:hypothetical protein
VGDGENIRIWRDNWLPRNHSLKPLQGKTRARHRRVNQLTVSGSNCWNEHLIRKIFYQHDADLILKTSPPDESKRDFLACHYENNGMFSVKSAYKLAYNICKNGQYEATTSEAKENKRNIWNHIWSAPVPSKVKVFGWRTAKDNLPTKTNKFKRSLELDKTCIICGHEAENSCHATVACTKARALRDEMRKTWDLPSEENFGYMGLIGSLSCLQILPKVEEALFSSVSGVPGI